jgi:integrase
MTIKANSVPTVPTALATQSNKSTVSIQRAVVRGVEKFCVWTKISGKRKRAFFDEPTAAVAYRDQILRQLSAKGTESFAVSGKTVAEGWREFQMLRLPKLRGSNARLVQWWIGHYVEEQGRMLLAAVSPRDIDAFLARKEWSGTTRQQGFVYLRLFFNWLVRYEHLDRSPVQRAERPQAAPVHHLLTVAQVKRLIALTSNCDRMRAWLVLGVFGGMRISEVGRALPEHIEAVEIFVPQTKSTDPEPRPRFVPILPALRRHLPKKWDCLGEDHIKRARTALALEMGWDEWPQNCLRHTAASMHYAAWQDAGKTAYFLGHSSPKMVRERYARAVRKKEAKAFWAL